MSQPFRPQLRPITAYVNLVNEDVKREAMLKAQQQKAKNEQKTNRRPDDEPA